MDYYDLKTGIIVTQNQKQVYELNNRQINILPAYEFLTKSYN